LREIFTKMKTIRLIKEVIEYFEEMEER
jgi:hypothetical protein